MRTTIELPEELLLQAKSRAALAGISLREFFIQAIEQRLALEIKKSRRPPPEIGSVHEPAIAVLTPEQRDEAVFGPANAAHAILKTPR